VLEHLGWRRPDRVGQAVYPEEEGKTQEAAAAAGAAALSIRSARNRGTSTGRAGRHRASPARGPDASRSTAALPRPLFQARDALARSTRGAMRTRTRSRSPSPRPPARRLPVPRSSTGRRSSRAVPTSRTTRGLREGPPLFGVPHPMQPGESSALYRSVSGRSRFARYQQRDHLAAGRASRLTAAACRSSSGSFPQRLPRRRRMCASGGRPAEHRTGRGRRCHRYRGRAPRSLPGATDRLRAAGQHRRYRGTRRWRPPAATSPTLRPPSW